MAHPFADTGVGLEAPGCIFQQVGVKLHSIFLEQHRHTRAAEGEISLLVALGYRIARHIGLTHAAHHRRADLDKLHLAKRRRVDRGHDAFVLPKNRRPRDERDGVHRVQPAVD